MSIYEKLLEVQKELKAPKGQYNKFGGYNYRSCEDILEAVKPLMVKHKVTIFLDDTLTLIGERYYIEATAHFVDIEKGDEITVKGLAREEENKKGMDGSQITGSASSYARKYALNGLLAIDDNKDSDTTNDGTDKKGKKQDKKYREQLIALCKQHDIDMTQFALENGLNKQTTEEEYKALCEKLLKKTTESK